jgi:hypothetical protein
MTQRLAIGEAWVANPVSDAGLETGFNMDPARGAVRYPSMLHVQGQSSKVAMPLDKVVCPLVATEELRLFMTVRKMGYHGG